MTQTGWAHPIRGACLLCPAHVLTSFKSRSSAELDLFISLRVAHSYGMHKVSDTTELNQHHVCIPPMCDGGGISVAPHVSQLTLAASWLRTAKDNQLARPGQARPGQLTSRQVRSGHVRSGQVRSGQVRSGQPANARTCRICGFNQTIDERVDAKHETMRRPGEWRACGCRLDPSAFAPILVASALMDQRQAPRCRVPRGCASLICALRSDPDWSSEQTSAAQHLRVRPPVCFRHLPATLEGLS